MPRFSKLLIANRGEIAVRIARSARSLGYRTVAVYSDVDRGAPYVAAADEAVPLGGAAAAESYLSIERILAAAATSGADAIHPGYGFLSENADFAEACAAAGLTFVGPPAGAIRLMGNKVAAKERMCAAGVPCLPGSSGAQGDAAWLAAAYQIGFPVMLKAAAGGGGKGMRLVARPEHVSEALRATRAEAFRAFGSDELLLEKALVAPRHIEIQIFADGEGNVVHLGERDCSLQRRHQKVVEEAPSPAVTPELRERMGRTATDAARAVGYVGAGTVEFLLDASGAFYFLEMNVRLQVEHAVTEFVAGVDLVAWQLQVAAGEPLPQPAVAVLPQRHAIEARLYAEDPAAGFLPQAGTLVAWLPPAGDGVRVEHALAAGSVVSPFYDPMLAKIVGQGRNREEARRRLLAALEDLVVFGIPTNRDFLIACLDHDAFAAGDVRTDFIPLHFGAVLPSASSGFAAFALAAVLFEERAAGARPERGWRSSGVDASLAVLRSGDDVVQLDLEYVAARTWRVAAGDATTAIEVVALEAPRVRYLFDGVLRSASFAWAADVLHLRAGGRSATFSDGVAAVAPQTERAQAGPARAPMPGIVVDVRVSAGERIEKGRCLVVLEAMKMLHEISAGRDGVVASVHVRPGERVGLRDVLVELEGLAGSSAGA